MSKIATGYVALKADSKDLKRDMSKAQKDVFDATHRMQDSANKTSKAFKAMWIAAAAGATAAIVVLKKAVDLANQQELAEKKLEAVVRATGQAAGYNADQLKEMAASLQRVTTYGDETIIEMQAILATFKQIRGEAFERTTAAVLDMATVMGTDLRSAAIQVAKALNDPVANLGALGRAGVQFTDTQKEMIKGLWEAGDAAKAQDIILKELETQFGGTAKEVTDTFGGAMKQLKNVFGDALEDIGEGITKNEELIDSVHLLRDAVIDLTERGDLQTWATSAAHALSSVAKIATALVSVMDKLYNVTVDTLHIVFPEDPFGYWEEYVDHVQKVIDVLMGLRDAQTGALKPTPENLAGVGAGPATGPYGLTIPKGPAETMEGTAFDSKAAAQAAAGIEDMTDAEEGLYSTLVAREQFQQEMADKDIARNAMELEAKQKYWEEQGRLADEALMAEQELTQDQLDSIWQMQKDHEERIKQLKMTSAQQTYNALMAIGQAYEAWTGKKNKTLFRLEQAMAIAIGLIKTYQAANEALASPPGPPWTIPLAAAITAMGLANVATIAAQKVGGGTVGGAGAAATATTPATNALAPATTPLIDTEEKKAINIYFEGGVITDKAFLEDLAEKLSRLVEGSEVRLVSSETRAT